MKDKSIRLWNKNFLLLWQGQFVSAVGDVAYEIALGFWILAATGSTALMGSLMAASAIPRVLLSPIAGVVADRINRKWVLVGMDALRGAAVVLVAVSAFTGDIKIWMVFAAGVIIGIGAAFFNPTVAAAVPDIVPRDRLVKANSFFSMIRAGSGILGNSLGGILFTILGAPLMFLVNGLSYIFSSISELFIHIPSFHQPGKKNNFWSDFKDGIRYVWDFKGLRFMIVTAGILNFFAWIALVLILPFFERDPDLGAVKYGIIMAAFTIGTLAGMAFTASVDISAGKRFRIFILCMFVFVISLAIFPLVGNYIIMILLVVAGGFANAIVNVLMISVIQLVVPAAMRGKVMGFLETFSQGLTPIGMAIGGVLGEFLPLHLVISGSFVVIGTFIFPLMFSGRVREFFSLEAETD